MILRRPFVLSLCAHIAAFGLIGLTFGNKLTIAHYPQVFFWGNVLSKSDVTPVKFFASGSPRDTFSGETLRSAKAPSAHQRIQLNSLGVSCVKPTYAPALVAEKETIPINLFPSSLNLEKKPATITFHPQLPYYLLLYFKDRQRVHIELEFTLIPNGKNNSIVVKRKISSGNLEADLLSVRYINLYLLRQQGRFPVNTPKTVQIDLYPGAM